MHGSLGEFLFKATSDETWVTFRGVGATAVDYSISLEETSIADDHGDSQGAATSVQIGSTAAGTFEVVNDADVFELEFEAGKIYTFEFDLAFPIDELIYGIVDQSGKPVAANFAGLAFNETYFYAPATGTYYLTLDQKLSYGGLGSYSFTVSDDPVTASPLDSIDWGTQLSSSVVTYYFADAGYEYPQPDPLFSSADYTAESWTNAARASMRGALDTYENVSSLTFVEVASAEAADFVLVNDWDISVGGYFEAPGKPYAGLGVFNTYVPDNYPEFEDHLDRGAHLFEVFVHEIGHGVGLAHPHDTGGGTGGQMLNVQYSYDWGLFDLNQTAFTVMSYNEGWNSGPSGYPPFSYTSGYQSGPATLDIALI